MSIQQLSVLNFRNLNNNKIEFHPNLNLITGDNGSGKSSILEAVFFISHGKSFRTNKTENIVNHDFSQFVINIKDNLNKSLGISKDHKTNKLDIKVDNIRLSKLSELAKNIAVQIITPESFKLFFGGPKERRRFIDLGLFHVKHDFSLKWRQFSKVLKQRNACLRNKVGKQELVYWTVQFIEYSELIASDRFQYVGALKKELVTWLNILLPELQNKIELNYSQGWSQKKSLEDVLTESYEKEILYGYSIAGAQKFDIKFTVNKQPLDAIISRGQQKLFLLALTLAQSKLIEAVMQVKPILMIDDIGAELDLNSRKSLAIALDKINCQVIATAINPLDLEPLVPKSTTNNNENYKMFHVKHGEISIECE